VTDGPITVVGAGAIGGFAGARLLAAGHDVRFVETNREHVDAIRSDGLRVTGAVSIHVRPEVAFPEELDGTLGLVLLAVKARDTAAALGPIVPRLAAEGCVVSLQNGLEEYRIAAAVGDGRTIGASLTFGGTYEAPGRVAYAGPGSFHVGELDGSMSERVERLVTVLAAVHAVEPTDRIFAHLWGKAAVGAYYFATALVDADVLEILADDERLPSLGALVAEVARVASAEGVVCEPVDGFDPDAFLRADEAGIRASWEAQRRYWRGLEARRTGVWRDLWVHRRPTEVREIVGPVLERARRHGIETPGLDGLFDAYLDRLSASRPSR
jgi:2-dehydropantoate 2-reductase